MESNFCYSCLHKPVGGAIDFLPECFGRNFNCILCFIVVYKMVGIRKEKKMSKKDDGSWVPFIISLIIFLNPISLFFMLLFPPLAWIAVFVIIICLLQV